MKEILGARYTAHTELDYELVIYGPQMNSFIYLNDQTHIICYLYSTI